MKDRLLKLLTQLNYSATKFADEIGVQRSGISHILSGRNKPSYDFIVKILNKFPELDAEWLILGKGVMFKTNKSLENINFSSKKTTLGATKTPDLFSVPVEKIHTPITSQPDSIKVTYVTPINRIIILSADGTFDVYNPARKD
jgi:transcriptional regulator with XRE-family HTH domain